MPELRDFLFCINEVFGSISWAYERLDKNIVMPLCIMGCDSLFEKGYLLVNNEGLVEINQNKTITKKVDSYVSKLKGNK